jgi:hypothetical protein
VKRKTKDALDVATNKVVPAAEDFVHHAADRVGPLVHGATERVAPLAQSAADRIGAAADRVAPLAHTAADRVAPLGHAAAERVAPLAHSAADRIAPLASQAVERVGPYAHQAAGKVAPYAHQAAERVAPLAAGAKQRGAQVAHDAVERYGPKLEDALERVSPAIDAAREKMHDDVLPRLSDALSAASGSPVVAEATSRAHAVAAAAKGELVLPPKKKKGRWIKRLAIVAAIGGVVVVVARRLMGKADSDWQAARPTAPYSPPKSEQAATPEAVVDATAATNGQVTAEASDDPQAGTTAHLADADANAEPAADDVTAEEVQADGSVAEAAGFVPTPEETDETPPGESPPESVEGVEAEEPVSVEAVDQIQPDENAGPPLPRPKYEGEGVYVGSDPPEGYSIKGNERSRKYHVPESGGYSRTTAEVWFNSEEAAQRAGFVRAQR